MGKVTRKRMAVWLVGAALCGNFAGAQDREKPSTARLEIPAFQGKVLGMSLDAERLGVVLDVSQSMKEALPAIRAELKQKLPRHPVLHVDGCKLEKPEPRARVVNGMAPEAVTAVSTLAELGEVDAVLWISDMGDASNRYGVEAMKEVLATHGLQFYILSVERKPSPGIRKLAEGTDGWWTVTPVDSN